MDKLIRNSISDIIKNHTQLISIAIRQRAKFEGWLKFELANHLQKLGMSNVEVESNYVDSNNRADLAFVLFPVPVGDSRWLQYLDRISHELGFVLTEEDNCSRVEIPIDDDNNCEVVICCFSI